MTGRYRNVASGKGKSAWRNPVLPISDKHVAKKLFIKRSLKKAIKNSGDSLIYGFSSHAVTFLRKICENYEPVKGIRFTFDAIRPSVILKKYFEGDLDAGIAQSGLGHSSKKHTTGYVLRYVSKLALERGIRSFQNQFEAVMIADIPNAAKELGYTPMVFEGKRSQGVNAREQSMLDLACSL